jgi:hypothetical protein
MPKPSRFEDEDEHEDELGCGRQPALRIEWGRSSIRESVRGFNTLWKTGNREWRTGQWRLSVDRSSGTSTGTSTGTGTGTSTSMGTVLLRTGTKSLLFARVSRPGRRMENAQLTIEKGVRVSSTVYEYVHEHGRSAG